MSTATQDFFALKDANQVGSDQQKFDLLLAKEVPQRMTERKLIFGMHSGKAVPIESAKAVAVMHWPVTDDSRQCMAIIKVYAIQICVFLDDSSVINKLIRGAKKDYAHWVEKGGFHQLVRWQSPHYVHELPFDYMEVDYDGNDWTGFSHLYQRPIKLSLTLPSKVDDYREQPLFQQLRAVMTDSALLPYTGQATKFLESLELPQPYSWARLLEFGLGP